MDQERAAECQELNIDEFLRVFDDVKAKPDSNVLILTTECLFDLIPDIVRADLVWGGIPADCPRVIVSRGVIFPWVEN